MPANPSISTRRVVLVYAVFAATWILVSDQVVAWLIPDPAAAVRANTAKGWLFVAVTSALLYGLVARLVQQVREQGAARERAAQASYRKFLTFVEEAPAALAMFDREMRYLAASRRWRDDYCVGIPDVVGRSQYELFPWIPEEWKQAHRKGMAGEVIRADEDIFRRADGEQRWVAWEIRPWRADDDQIGGIMIFSEDITARKRAEDELRIAATAFESRQPMFITDPRSVILRVNRAFEETTGYGAAEIIGKTPRTLKSGRHDKAFYEELWASLRTTHGWHGEIWNRRKNGEVYPEDLTISAVLDTTGAVTNYVGTFTDISKSKLAEETIRSLSFYDALTGLPNRRLTMERLKQDLSSLHRATHYGALLIINLDRFSLLNDTRSYLAGDAVLVETARRINACLSATDSAGRLGGDEFVALVDDLGSDLDRAALRARDLSETIMAGIRQPIIIDGSEYFCTACIGIAIYLGGQTEIDELMKQANAALYQARRLGPDHLHFFDSDMQAALEERVRLELLLRKATPGQLLLHYQPQVDQFGRISGVEALIRWRHPQKGIIVPAHFIPLAEETGAILDIGKWVLEAACRRLKSWEAQPGTRGLFLAVNISARQIEQAGFVDQVIEALESSGADPGKLELELTESMLLQDADLMSDKMAALKARGIRFSLDDFGTGFSSLAYLRRMPIDKLKIDQSFISDVNSNASDAAIARSIIALGRSLGLDVIAEGVETREQQSFLAVHGCDAYQGFLFGKPVAPEDLEDRVRSAAAAGI